jgi:hypothetical protein
MEVNFTPIIWNDKPALMYYVSDITQRKEAEAADRKPLSRL